MFKSELDRLEQRLFEADWAEARARLGDKATAADLARTAAQRRHDAVVEMARRSAAYTDDTAPAARVVVNIHTDYPTFLYELSKLTDSPLPAPEIQLRETADGTLLSGYELVNAALAGEVRRVVFDGDGHVLDLGRSNRLFTRTLADAIAARDRVCRMPGCHLPASKCQTDHIREWNDGGTTSVTNGQLLCAVRLRRGTQPQPVEAPPPPTLETRPPTTRSQIRRLTRPLSPAPTTTDPLELLIQESAG